MSIWTDKGIDPVDVVGSVFGTGLNVGEGRGTNVGVAIGVATGVTVASRIGGLAVVSFNGVAIAGGTNVGATMVDSLDGSLQAEIMAITIKIIGMTLIFRFT